MTIVGTCSSTWFFLAGRLKGEGRPKLLSRTTCRHLVTSVALAYVGPSATIDATPRPRRSAHSHLHLWRLAGQYSAPWREEMPLRL